MLIEEKGIIPRILRDMNEGVLVLDRKGVILYLNEKGRTLLGKTENPEGKNTALLFWQRKRMEQMMAFTNLCWTLFMIKRMRTVARRFINRQTGRLTI